MDEATLLRNVNGCSHTIQNDNNSNNNNVHESGYMFKNYHI